MEVLISISKNYESVYKEQYSTSIFCSHGMFSLDGHILSPKRNQLSYKLLSAYFNKKKLQLNDNTDILQGTAYIFYMYLP